MFRKYLRKGLGVILPVVFTFSVIAWVIGEFTQLFYKVTGLTIAWWGSIAGLILTGIAIILLGVVFTHVRPVIKLVRWLEIKIIKRFPFVKGIYGFGEEVRELLNSMEDEEKAKLRIFEVDLVVIKLIGVMTNPEHNIGFLVSAPSPLTGIIAKFNVDRINYLDMKFSDLVKLNTSLGKIGGDKW